MVIALKFPAYLVPHERKVVWLIHQHRTAYELWDHPEFADLGKQIEGPQVRDMVQQGDRIATRRGTSGSSRTRRTSRTACGTRSDCRATCCTNPSPDRRCESHSRRWTFFEFAKTRLASPSAMRSPCCTMWRTCGPSSLAEVGELRVVPQLVRGAVLVDQPDHLALVGRGTPGTSARSPCRSSGRWIRTGPVATPPSGGRARSPGTTCRRPDLLGLVAGLRSARTTDSCASPLRRARTASEDGRPRSSPALPGLSCAEVLHLGLDATSRSASAASARRARRAGGRCVCASAARTGTQDLRFSPQARARSELGFAAREDLLRIRPHQHREVVEQVPNLGVSIRDRTGDSSAQ